MFYNLSSSTSIQVQQQEILTAEDGLQDPYLVILNLSTSEHLKLYNNEHFRLPESDRYDLNRSKWTEFYQ